MTNINSIIVIISSLYITSVLSQCGTTIDDTTFDLSPLQRGVIGGTQNYYSLTQMEDNIQYTYYWNFCADTDLPCTPDETEPFCIEFTGDTCTTFSNRSSDISSMTIKSYTDGCDRLSGSENEVNLTTADPPLIEYELINTNDPNEGIIMTYNYGDLCQEIAGVDRNYGFRFTLYCNQSATDLPDGLPADAVIDSVDECTYSITLQTNYACPVTNATTTQQPANVTNATTPTTMPPTAAPTLSPTLSPLGVNETRDPTLEPTLAPTATPTQAPIGGDEDSEYSLFGSFAKYDWDDNLLIAFRVGVDIQCTFVDFLFIQPSNRTWVGVGFGGDYSYESSSEEDVYESSHDHDDTTATEPETTGDVDDSHESTVAQNMNGYGIISATNDVNTGIYETWLYAAAQPQPQTQNDLTGCQIVERDGTRYSYCRRPYETDDTNNPDKDFYKFVEGANDIIWAFGVVNDDDSIEEHGHYNYGQASADVMYLNGDAGCGYAASQSGTSSGRTQEEEAWMITAIVFIICFAIVLGILLFLIYKIKQDPDQRNKFSKVSDADEQEPINTN